MTLNRLLALLTIPAVVIWILAIIGALHLIGAIS